MAEAAVEQFEPSFRRWEAPQIANLTTCADSQVCFERAPEKR